MPVTVVQNLEGAQNTGLATNTVAHSATTAGNTLILIVGSDDYRLSAGSNRPESSGYALVTGGAQETFLGHYMWWKVAAGGETSVQYTIGSAATSCWEFYEVSGLDTSAPLDISSGQLAASAGNTYTTTSITPSAGDRWLLASMGGSLSTANPTGMGTWLNSFVELNDTATALASGTRDVIGAASRSVTADGVTSYSSGATYDAQSPQTRTAIIAAFKLATSGTAPALPPSRLVRRRLATAPRLPRGRGRISTPVRAQVNPPFPFTGMKQPRRLRGILPRRGEAWAPVPAQVVVAAPAFPPRGVRSRLKGLRLFRPEAFVPVQPPAVPVAPAYPPQSLRAKVRGLRLFRPRVATPLKGQRLAPTQARVRQRLQLKGRGHIAGPPVPQAPAIAPAYPPQGWRTRLRLLRQQRGRAATPVPAQIVVTPPGYPVQPLRTRLRGAHLSRPAAVTPVPPQAGAVPPSYAPRPLRPRTKVVRALRSRFAAPTPPQIVAAPPAYPVRPVRSRLKGLRSHRGHQAAMPVPPQIVIVAPKFVPLFSRLKQHAARIFRGKTAVQAVSVCTCTTARPDSGTTARPTSSITARPSSGIVARSSSGSTIRPDTGTTERPCSCS